mmetsp:Transcript_26404/g.90836  ORF Transcript_26404/g.90836 Transcript_26404/m.90836 type:complete len:231 (+) Transcript_26404:950-1642(+)
MPNPARGPHRPKSRHRVQRSLPRTTRRPLRPRVPVRGPTGVHQRLPAAAKGPQHMTPKPPGRPARHRSDEIKTGALTVGRRTFVPRSFSSRSQPWRAFAAKANPTTPKSDAAKRSMALSERIPLAARSGAIWPPTSTPGIVHWTSVQGTTEATSPPLAPARAVNCTPAAVSAVATTTATDVPAATGKGMRHCRTSCGWTHSPMPTPSRPVTRPPPTVANPLFFEPRLGAR